MLLKLHFVTYIRIFFGHCHVSFPYKEPHSFPGSFVQNVIVPCFSDPFVQITTQQSDVICNVTSDSQVSYKFYTKQRLYFSKHI